MLFSFHCFEFCDILTFVLSYYYHHGLKNEDEKYYINMHIITAETATAENLYKLLILMKS